MIPSKARACLVLAIVNALLSGAAFADASYQSTTQVTGGALVDTMKSMSFLSKSMREAFAPISTTTMVSGNRKATVDKDSIQIVDLDKEEMIHIDLVKKTYSVVTFAQMRQAMQQMPERINEAQAQASQPQKQQKPNIKTSFTVGVKNTGAQKEVNGLTAQEQVLTLTMTVTDLDAPANDPSKPNTATFVVTTDAWIAPDPPEVKEISDFDQRMAKKMMEGVDAQAWIDSMRSSSPGMASLLGSKPGASDAMAQMAKEAAKLQGTHVMDVVSMGALAPAGAAGSGGSAGAAQGQQGSGGSAAGQVAGDTAVQTAAGESSNRMGTFGSALGGSMMSAWHRKKAKQNADANASSGSGSSAAPSAEASTTVNGSTQGMQTVVLLSTTEQKMNFSGDAVPASAFEIPAGYTQVTSPLTGMQ